MSEYITDLGVSLNQAEEQKLQSQGFKKINVDLNKGAGGKTIFLWYNKVSGTPPITNIQFTFNKDMTIGLIDAGYTKIPKDLNAGAGGNYIYLWYCQGTGEFQTPITEISVTTAESDNEVMKYGLGWERLTCDLNRGAARKWIHAWLKREKQTYICDVTVTNSYALDFDNFTKGYIRADENINRGRGGAPVFIWYRQTTDPKKAVSDLQVSTNDDEYQQNKQDGYQLVDVNLNKGTGGKKVYLWYKKGFNKPIKAIVLLFNTRLVKEYEKAGVTAIQKNLKTGTSGRTQYLCYYKKCTFSSQQQR